MQIVMMMMQKSVVLFIGTTLLLLAAAGSVSAFPQGPPNCNGGLGALDYSSHSRRNPTGNGQVEDGGFQVSIDGTPLMPGEAGVTLESGIPMTIEITGTPAEFKGHFFRLGQGTNGVETPEAFSDPVSSQILSACVAEGIAGFTHTDNALKNSASATLTFPNGQADTGVPLDVIIVVSNSDSFGGDSTYYYSQYILDFAAV